MQLSSLKLNFTKFTKTSVIVTNYTIEYSFENSNLMRSRADCMLFILNSIFIFEFSID